jgi:hypothetical protein
MRKAIVIKSFCNTEEKIEELRNIIKTIKEKIGYPILLHAGYNIPLDIINSVNYYIGYNNSTLTLTNNYRWRTIDGWNGEFRSYVPDYGFAEAIQLKVCTSFLNDLGFNVAHILNYDVDIEQSLDMDLFNKHEELMSQGAECVYHKVKERYAGLLFYSIDVKAFKEKVNDYITGDLWDYIMNKAQGSMAENVFYWLFHQTKAKSYVDDLLLNDFISTKWVEESGFNDDLQGLIREGGIYPCEGNEKCILLLDSVYPLYGEIIIDGTVVNTTETNINAVLIEKYPESVKYIYKINRDEIEIFTEDKMETMKKRLMYHDAN